MPTPRRRVRAVLAVGSGFGMGYLIYRLLSAETGVAIDLGVYRVAARAIWAGELRCGVSHVGSPGYTYRYPPVWLVWLSTSLHVGPFLGCVVHSVIVLGGRPGSDALAGGLPPSSESVTSLGPLSTVRRDADQAPLTLVALGLLVPVVTVLSRRADGPIADMCGVFGTLAALLLVLPSVSLDFLALAHPFFPLLYLPPGPPGAVFAVRAGPSMLTLKFPDDATVPAAAPASNRGPVPVAATALCRLATPTLVGTP